jgi:hypothetical protein
LTASAAAVLVDTAVVVLADIFFGAAVVCSLWFVKSYGQNAMQLSCGNSVLVGLLC